MLWEKRIMLIVFQKKQKLIKLLLVNYKENKIKFDSFKKKKNQIWFYTHQHVLILSIKRINASKKIKSITFFFGQASKVLLVIK